MSPDQIKLFSAALALVGELGVAQVGVTLVIILFAPWMVLVIVSIAQHRRFEAVVKMYENNFAQTEGITALTEGYRNMTEGYRELVQWTTVEVTETKEAVVNNMHCPIVRKHAKPKDLNNG